MKSTEAKQIIALVKKAGFNGSWASGSKYVWIENRVRVANIADAKRVLAQAKEAA